MTKIFKNSKQVLSYVLAFAVLAVSLFTGVVINSDAACDGTVNKWSGSWNDTTLADNGETGADWDNAIIIDSADELAFLCKTGDNDKSLGKYYKVANGIKAFNMNVTTNDDMSGDMTAEEVKAIFDGKKAGATWWADKYFKGHFDGNGAVVYGLYSTGQGQAALFPRVSVASGNVTIKNITIKNSYFYGDSAAPLVAQEASWTANTVYIENCQAHDNYCENYRKNDAISNGGHLVAYVSSVLNLNNCFVSGNIVKHRGYFEDITTYNIPEYSFFGYNNHKDSVISNTIMLGCTPISLNNFANGMQPDNFSNVYTDTMPDGSRTVYRTEKDGAGKNDSWVERTYTDNGNGTFSIAWSGETINGTFKLDFDYNCSDTDTQIKVISADDIKGSAATATMKNLDWENTWFATNGVPELRALHDLTAVTPDANGHGYECADCDIDAVVTHVWGEDYKCVDCRYACKHDNGNLETTDTDGDCVTAPGQYVSCKECGYYDEFTTGTALGHIVEWVAENPEDCKNEGRQGYWHCTVCQGNFVAETEEEAKWAPMDSSYANPETDLIIPADPVGGHSQKNNADGVIVIVDGANGHYYECSVCDGKLNHKSELLEEGEVVSHDFSASVCKECGWACTEHNYELTGNILVVGDCYTDHEDEIKCTICGKQESKVTKASHNIVPVDEVKATDKMEGTKAHYQCTECKSIYADAEGKTSITKASLVIAKKLPAGYENTYEGTGGATVPENADTSNKSPSTADSVMTVVAAVAVLVGAAYVVVRKVVKA